MPIRDSSGPSTSGGGERPTPPPSEAVGGNQNPSGEVNPQATQEGSQNTQEDQRRILNLSEREIFAIFNRERLQQILVGVADRNTREAALEQIASVAPFSDEINDQSSALNKLLKERGWTQLRFEYAWETKWAPKVKYVLRHWAENIESKHVESQISLKDKAKAGWYIKAKFMAKSVAPVLAGTFAVGVVARKLTGGTGIGMGAITGAAAGLFRKLNSKRAKLKEQGQEVEEEYQSNLDQVRQQLVDSSETQEKVMSELGGQSPNAVLGIISEIIREGSAIEVGETGDANEMLLKEEILRTRTEREGSKEEVLENKADSLIAGLYGTSIESRAEMTAVIDGNIPLQKALEKMTKWQRGDLDSGGNSVDMAHKKDYAGTVAAMAAGAGMGAGIMWDSSLRVIPGALAGAYMGMRYGQQKDKEAQKEAFVTVVQESVQKAEDMLNMGENRDIAPVNLDQMSDIESNLRVALQMGVLRNNPALLYRARNILRSIDSHKIEQEQLQNKKAEQLLWQLAKDTGQMEVDRSKFIDAFRKKPKWRTYAWGLAGALMGGAAAQALGSAVKEFKEFLVGGSDQVPEVPSFEDGVQEPPSDMSKAPITGGERTELPEIEIHVDEDGAQEGPSDMSEVPETPESDLGTDNPELLEKLHGLQEQFPSLDDQELREYLDLAKLNKGEGPEHRLIKQMSFLGEHLDGDDKQKFFKMIGYNPNGRVDLDTAVGRSAHRLAIGQRYMTADNKYLAYPKWKDGTDQWYLLGADQNGKLEFSHTQSHGKDLEVHLDKATTKAELRGEAQEDQTPSKERISEESGAEEMSSKDRILELLRKQLPPEGETAGDKKLTLHDLVEQDQPSQPSSGGEHEVPPDPLKERVPAEEVVPTKKSGLDSLKELVPAEEAAPTEQPDKAEQAPADKEPDTQEKDNAQPEQQNNQPTGPEAAGPEPEVQEIPEDAYTGPDTIDRLSETERYVQESGNLDYYTPEETAQYNRVHDALGWQYELFGKNGSHLNTYAEKLGLDPNSPGIREKLTKVMNSHYDAVQEFESGTKRNLSASAIEAKVKANMFGDAQDIPTPKEIKNGVVFDKYKFFDRQQWHLRKLLQPDIEHVEMQKKLEVLDRLN